MIEDPARFVSKENEGDLKTLKGALNSSMSLMVWPLFRLLVGVLRANFDISTIINLSSLISRKLWGTAPMIVARNYQ